MRFLFQLILFGLALIVSDFARADLYEERMPRPQGSGEHAEKYIENDEDQIKEVVWPSFISRRSYNVYLPNGETEARSYKRPAIVLLHGAGRSGVSLVERWREVSDDHDVILLGPHSWGRWSVSDASGFIPAMLKDATKKYNIDTDKVYVFGHSMGGSFVFLLAAIMSEQFAAAGVHAGAFESINSVGLVKEAKRKIPLIIINGTHDKGFPLDSVRASANIYSKLGHDVGLFILDGHGHWYYDIAPYINEMVWDFFKYERL